MSKGKILITDEVHPVLVEGLQSLSYEVNYNPKIGLAEVEGVINEYTGLLINSRIYAGKNLIDKGAKLKFIARIGSGLEVIDVAYSKQKNIIALNAPEGNRMAVAEFALGSLLNLMRNLAKADAEVKNYRWIREANRGYELTGKTVGLIAYGNNAQAFAKVLSGFDVKILAYDKYYTGFGNAAVTESSLKQIFEEADVLSLHLPLTEETTYMVDYSFLSSFKKPYWLINTSRGKVMRTADMLRCFEQGKIIAAALDVLENEKLDNLSAEEKAVFDQLISSGKIYLSPHIAGWTYESKRRIAEVLLEKIARI
jgi:D-3-phosphoglycerate dehydrogenase